MMNQIDPEKTLVAGLEYSLPEKPHMEVQKTLNLILVNGRDTCLKLNTPEC